eukprot:777341-Prorocentrum_minimum.AAC.1
MFLKKEQAIAMAGILLPDRLLRAFLKSRGNRANDVGRVPSKFLPPPDPFPAPEPQLIAEDFELVTVLFCR